MDVSPEFFDSLDLGHRDWGTEKLLCYSSGKWMMKVIEIKKGCKGGFQYHRVKDEGGLVISGRLVVRYTRNNEILSAVLEEGSAFRFPPGCIHQEEALTDVKIIEVSTPHLNDRVRMEAVFGLTQDNTGLQTTMLDDVQEI